MLHDSAYQRAAVLVALAFLPILVRAQDTK
jgi:hypothetical protein